MRLVRAKRYCIRVRRNNQINLITFHWRIFLDYVRKELRKASYILNCAVIILSAGDGISLVWEQVHRLRRLLDVACAWAVRAVGVNVYDNLKFDPFSNFAWKTSCRRSHMNGQHRLSRLNVGLTFLVSLERPRCRHPIVVQAMTWWMALQNLAALIPEHTSGDDANLLSSLSVSSPCGTGTCAAAVPTLLPGRVWGGGSTDKPRL
jgi:hypothetical protein